MEHTRELAPGYVLRGELDDMRTSIINDLQAGKILIPQVLPQQANYAGGLNHCPDSDISFSTEAATVAGTLPADAGDTNQEAYRITRDEVGSDLTIDAAHALKAVGHSLFAADEGVNLGKPRWDRVNGWIEIGASGATQYDVAFQLLNKAVGPGQRWFFLARIGALTADIVPADVQLYAGLWVKAGATEGWAEGAAFDLTYIIKGTPGTTSTDYRVLAKTDSGVSILSNVLTVADAPDVLSDSDYPQLFFSAGPGFIEFEIYRKRDGAFALLFTVRNSIDLQYNDVGAVGQPKPDWPADPGNLPRAFAQTRTLIVGPYGSTWALNELSIAVPSTFNFANVDNDGMFLRVGLSAATTVDRQIGLDRIWFSTTFNEWAPDAPITFSDGTTAIPSISPTSGSQGGSGGVVVPPDDGSGGGRCILTRMPMMIREGRRNVFRRYRHVTLKDRVKGQHRTPYNILLKRTGWVAGYYVIKTENGIRYECNARHPLIVDLDRDQSIQAEQVRAGETVLEGMTLRGRRFRTLVVSKKWIPRPVEVGTVSLIHPDGLSAPGRGMYIAGYSPKSDRGLISRNAKPIEQF